VGGGAAWERLVAAPHAAPFRLPQPGGPPTTPADALTRVISEAAGRRLLATAMTMPGASQAYLLATLPLLSANQAESVADRLVACGALARAALAGGGPAGERRPAALGGGRGAAGRWQALFPTAAAVQWL